MLRVIQLRSGGSVTLTASEDFNFFKLNAEDRQFFGGLLDRIDNYETGPEVKIYQPRPGSQRAFLIQQLLEHPLGLFPREIRAAAIAAGLVPHINYPSTELAKMKTSGNVVKLPGGRYAALGTANETPPGPQAPAGGK